MLKLQTVSWKKEKSSFQSASALFKILVSRLQSYSYCKVYEFSFLSFSLSFYKVNQILFTRNASLSNITLLLFLSFFIVQQYISSQYQFHSIFYFGASTFTDMQPDSALHKL